MLWAVVLIQTHMGHLISLFSLVLLARLLVPVRAAIVMDVEPQDRPSRVSQKENGFSQTEDCASQFWPLLRQNNSKRAFFYSLPAPEQHN